MDGVKSKPIRIFLPGFADKFIRGKTSESFESSGKVVSGHEVSHVCMKLEMAVVMEAINGGFFDGAIHTFDLSVGPGMPGLGEAMIDSMPKTDPVEGVSAETSRGAFAIFGQIGELDPVVGEHGMNAIGNGCYQGQKKGCGCLHIGSFDQFHEGKLRSTVNGYKQIKTALGSAHLSQIDVKVANRITLEFFPAGFPVALHFRQSADARCQDSPTTKRKLARAYRLFGTP